MRKENGSSWPFWSKVLEAEAGDLVLHLYGKTSPAFIGYSTVASDGYQTRQKPPEPNPWSYSEMFYRAELKDFVPFETPIDLHTLFAARREALEEYLDWNRTQGTQKKNIFCVKQAGRLQCQNGGYLSDLDERLADILFDMSLEASQGRPVLATRSVRTSEQYTRTKRRIGQQTFSKKIKDQHGGRCCFPSCEIADPRFVVGAHIDRWSDNEALRGHLGNGIPLCLMHDKAFELGLFMIDEHYCVIVNQDLCRNNSLLDLLMPYSGHRLRTGAELPLPEAFSAHRMRISLRES